MKKISDNTLKIIVGGIILVTFLFIVVAAVFKQELAENNLIIHIVGVIEGSVVTIVAFYFGSSKSSQDKDKNKTQEDEHEQS